MVYAAGCSFPSFRKSHGPVLILFFSFWAKNGPNRSVATYDCAPGRRAWSSRLGRAIRLLKFSRLVRAPAHGTWRTRAMPPCGPDRLNYHILPNAQRGRHRGPRARPSAQATYSPVHLLLPHARCSTRRRRLVPSRSLPPPPRPLPYVSGPVVHPKPAHTSAPISSASHHALTPHTSHL